MQVEICCGSYEDGLQAFAGGARRIELNSALYMGGLTPSIGALTLCKKLDGLEVISMVRVRGGGFCYSEHEYAEMLSSANLLLNAESDGIAFGFLHADFTVDSKRTREMVESIHQFGKKAVFHRAFDCCEGLFEAIEELIACGVDRVLTSGGEKDAMCGKQMLKKLVDKYGKQIEILAGCGIHAGNALAFKDDCGIQQVHSSCKGYREDQTCSHGEVSYVYDPTRPYVNQVVDRKAVEALLTSVKK